MIHQAIILAAGFGKRLGTHTQTLPKPLIPVQGRPIISHVIDKLRQHHVTHFVVNTHYLADQMRHYLESLNLPSLTISYEPQILETAGGIVQMLSYLNPGPFFCINADVWWQDASEAPLLSQLSQKWSNTSCAHLGAIATLIPPPNAIGYTGQGDFSITQDHVVFPPQDKNPDTELFINAGIQIFHPRAFHTVPHGPSALRSVYEHLSSQAQLLYHIHTAPWCDMGTPQTLEQLNHYVMQEEKKPT